MRDTPHIPLECVGPRPAPAVPTHNSAPSPLTRPPPSGPPSQISRSDQENHGASLGHAHTHHTNQAALDQNQQRSVVSWPSEYSKKVRVVTPRLDPKENSTTIAQRTATERNEPPRSATNRPTAQRRPAATHLPLAVPKPPSYKEARQQVIPGHSEPPHAPRLRGRHHTPFP